MRNKIIFFANTLWFLEKFKYELIKDISKDNEVTCIYLRKGPPHSNYKIDTLTANNVNFESFNKFFFIFLSSKIFSLLKSQQKF